MNPYTGDIGRFGSGTNVAPPPRRPERPQVVPEGWLSLTEEEAEEFQRLPKILRVERYIKYHRNDKCADCGGFVGNHSTKRFLRCAASELVRLKLNG